MNRKAILEIVDANSGGLKGLELMTEVIERIGPAINPAINPETFFDDIELLIKRELPELGVLHYAHKLDDTTFREKIFVYRKEPVCCPEAIRK